MRSRRDFLRAGGLGLAGLAAAPLDVWALAVGTADQGGRVDIRMRSDASGGRVWFDPLGVRVPPGTVVRWTLEANVHSTTAYHPSNGNFASRIPEGAEPWDSGILTEPGQTFQRRLDALGVYDYFCAPHELAGMVGRILVVPDGETRRNLREPGAAPGGNPPSPAARSAFPPIELVLRRGIVRHPSID